MIAAYRNVNVSRQHPLHHTLGDIRRQPSFREIHLKGLNLQEVRALINVTTGITPVSSLAEAIHVRTDGNPLFVRETVLNLSRDDLSAGSRLNIPIPNSVKEAINRSLMQVSKPCLDMLTTASAVGREFDFKILERLLDDTSQDKLLEAITEALDTNIIEELPQYVDNYQFRHSLIQETLVSGIPNSRRIRLHCKIGDHQN